MSIIYEALKKAEERELNSFNNLRKNSILRVILLGVIFSLLVFYSLGRLSFKFKKEFSDQEISFAMKKNFLKRDSHFSDLHLQGLIYDDKNPLVIINGKVLKKGETLDNIKVAEITPARVRLFDKKKNKYITLFFK